MFLSLRRQLAYTIRRHPLLPFLLAATVAVILLIEFFPPDGDRVTSIASLFALSGLLGVWISQLRRGWWLRALVAATIIFAHCFVVFTFDRQPHVEALLTIMLIYAAAIGAVGAASRFLGRVINRKKNGKASEPVQFSIWGIMAATTCVAVVLSLLRFADFPGGDPIQMVLGCTAMGVLPLLIHAIVRRTHRRRVVILGGMLVSTACSFAFIFGVGLWGRSQAAGWFIAVLVQGSFYLVWLLGLRPRLHGTRRPETQQPPADLQVFHPAPPHEEQPNPTATPSPIDLEA